jgi:hypothetical protein
MALLGDLKAHLSLYLGLHAALFLLYLGALRWVMARPLPLPHGGTIVIATAAIFRLILLPSQPSLSDDIWRYLWEGGLHWEGINPYAHPPDDPALEGLRDEVHARVNHRDLPAIYPPVSQWAMALGAAAGPSAPAMKAVFAIADMGLIAALMSLLRRRGLPPERALAYAWSPLAVVEVAVSGHNDPLAIALLLISTATMIGKRPYLSTTTLALAGLSKLFPWVLVPLFARQAKRALVVIPVLALACYLPYAGAGAGLYRSTVVYAESWRSNDSLFGLLVAAVQATGIPPVLTSWMSAHGMSNLYGQPHMLARLLAASLLAGLMGLLLRRQARGTMALDRGIFLFTAGALVLLPTLHPWYVLWALPWLAIQASPAWLALSGLVPLAYTGAWWAPWAEYLPFYGLLAAGAVARWRRGAPVLE